MNLKYEKAKLELGRISQARDEMKYKILERLEEVERLKGSIEAQEQAIEEKKLELEKLKGEE